MGCGTSQALRQSMIAFPYHLKPFQREVLVHRFDEARPRRNEMRLAPGGNSPGFGPHLLNYALQNPVDHADGSVIQTRADTRYGVRADHVLGRAEIDERQARGLT